MVDGWWLMVDGWLMVGWVVFIVEFMGIYIYIYMCIVEPNTPIVISDCIYTISTYSHSLI